MSEIDEYLDAVSASQKPILQRIRDVIKQAAPDATETISYGMPTFKLNGRTLIHFAAFKNHMSLFPTDDPSLGQLKDRMDKYRTSKGTLQFNEDNLMPDSLIRDIIALRIRTLSES